MQIFKNVNTSKGVREPYVATIGFFDGVHCGHRYLLDYVRREARRRGAGSLVITFPDSPSNVLNPSIKLPLLTTPKEKIQLLHETGIDIVVLIPFTIGLSNLTAEEFMKDILKTRLGVDTLVMGYDHRFGKQIDGEELDYESLGRDAGITVRRYQSLEINNDGTVLSVSSSSIRSSLLEGAIHSANSCLGYNYAMEGRVVNGHHIGKSIGFPTANLQVENNKLIPANGVYCVMVTTEDGKEFKGMLNIGKRPTLDNGSDRTVEVHILDFNDDLYGQTLRTSFLRYIRPERRFDSIEELRNQLMIDRKSCMDV